MSKIVLLFDGSSKGNPGKCSIGGCILKGEKLIYEYSYLLDEEQFETNTQAEYAAMIFGIQYCIKKKYKSIRVFGDSESTIKQMTGEYQVRSESIKFLYEKAMDMIQFFEKVEIGYIPREKNDYADKLANDAHLRYRVLEWKC